MFRAAVLIAAVLVSVLPAQDADRSAKLKQEIAATRKKLAALERELAAVTPVAGDPTLFPGVSPVGSVGHFGTQDDFWYFVVEEVVSEMEMIVHGVTSRSRGKSFLVTGLPTKDLADDVRVRLDAIFKIDGTRKVSGRTIYVVRPVTAKP